MDDTVVKDLYVCCARDAAELLATHIATAN